MIALQVNAAQLKKLERTLAHIKDGVPKALAPAINRALDKGRTTVKREIRKEYLIKYGDIPIRVQGASKATLGGAVIIQQGMLPLSKFKVTPKGVQRRKNKKPLHAQVKRGGGGDIPHGFFTSTGGPYVRKGASRLPIKKLMTIGAPIMASQPAVGPEVNKQMGDALAKNIDRQMVRVLNSAGGK